MAVRPLYGHVMKRLLVIASLIFVLGSVASAQPAAVLGQPLPPPDLDVGAISVRVVAGSPTAPVAHLTVTLVVGGQLHTAVTDAAGRAQFTGIAAGASVFARIIASDGLAHTSRTFMVPTAGGTRVMLSTEAWQPVSTLPSAREVSGMARPDSKIPAGSLVVGVTYDDLKDPKPPANVAVALVGYAADDTIAVITQRTDPAGDARFTGLDQTGATAYFAMTQLPRKGLDDRLIGGPVALDATAGVRLVLSGELRTATAAAVDDLAHLVEQDATVRAGKIVVRLEGALPEGEHAVSLVDATSGKVVASGKTTDPRIELGLPFHAGQIVYAETTSRARKLRSPPFQPVAARGTTTRIYDLPRILPTFQARAQLDDHGALEVVAAFDVLNNAWAPTEPAGLELALPHGFTAPELHGDDQTLATITKAGVRFSHAIPPGTTRVRVAFTLAIVAGKVAWSLDLPYGTYKSAISIDKVRGTAVEAPTATVSETDDNLVVDNISIVPHQSMAMTIHPGERPKLGPIDAACKPLQPERKPALGGKPLVDFTLPQLDGKPLHLASLRGKVLLVNFTASFASFAKAEPASLATLQKAVRDLVVVVVASDRDPHNVEELLGASPPYKVVLDAPVDEDHNLGEVTARWGVAAIPESFLVDRSGTVRYYFQNLRDWGSPDALACVRALTR
jgi:cytochrome c biogenesis protein CcmG, thiol:disulfide interchange protein DsbE